MLEAPSSSLGDGIALLLVFDEATDGECFYCLDAEQIMPIYSHFTTANSLQLHSKHFDSDLKISYSLGDILHFNSAQIRRYYNCMVLQCTASDIYVTSLEVTFY